MDAKVAVAGPVASGSTIALFALLPALFWLLFLYRHDRAKPEPLGLILLSIALGCAAAVATIAVGLFLPEAGPLVGGVLYAPVVEELFKFLGVYLVIYRRAAFDEYIDGIVYAGFVALGFAAFENVLYVVGAAREGLAAFWGTAGLRAVLAVPGHFLFATFWGYALGRARFTASGTERSRLIRRGLVGAMAAHAAYNFVVLTMFSAAAIVVVVMIVLWRVFYRRLRRLRALDAVEDYEIPATTDPR